MATDLDHKINAKVLRKITRSGSTITVRRYPSQSSDTSNGAVTDGSPVDKSVKGFGPFGYKQYYVDGEIIKVGDGYFVLVPKETNGTAFVPVLGDEIPRGGKTWRVVNFETASGGDEPAVYIVQVRA